MNALIILAGMGVLALLSELLHFRKALFFLLCIGFAMAIGACVYEWGSNAYFYNRMIIVDNFALIMTGLICTVSLLWMMFSKEYLDRHLHTTDMYALILFSLVGAFAMMSYNNFCMLFLGLEILSLSMYILAGSNKQHLLGNEAALKYFIMGSFATGFMLFGIALVYGVTGSFHLDTVMTYLQTHEGAVPQLFFVGVVLILSAMVFKVSAVPFHFWVPDVYTGSATMVTAFMATVVKIAAVVALFRMFVIGLIDAQATWLTPLVCISILTMLAGNLIATYQSRVKRMLAYSSIAHAGYLLIGVVSLHVHATASIFYYTMAYAIASLMSFGILYLLAGDAEETGFEAFNGLAKRNPLMALGMTVAMLSLAGIPPTAGFFAKYYLFSTAMQEGYYSLVIVAIIASLISIYYYFRVIIAMYAGQGINPRLGEGISPMLGQGINPWPPNEKLTLGTLPKVVIGLSSLLLIVLSILPEVFLRWLF